MISKSTGKELPKPKNPGKTIDFYIKGEIKGIEQVPQGDGINYSYNVLRRKSTQLTWQFYKSAYTLTAALKHYGKI
jgi:hypothetical protein